MKPILLSGLLFIFINISVAQDLQFTSVPIDYNASGHREIADIDQDGLNDIVAINHDQFNRSSIVWYHYPEWERNVIVRISEFVDYQIYRSCDMEAADLDLDGDIDIIGRIGLDNDEDGVICWFENPGKQKLSCSTLWERHDIGETEYIKDFEIRDFNLDSTPDIAARSNTNLYLYFQSKQAWQEKRIEIHHHEGMEAADLDRDGDEDIILNGFWLENPAGLIDQEWLEHNIDQKWYTQTTRNWQDNNSKVTVADINLDGWPDVVLAHSEKPGYPVSWYQNPENPVNSKWTEHVIGRIDKCHNLKVADFDMDGDPDVLAGTLPNFPEEAPHKFGIFVNRGNALRWDWQLLTDKGNYSAQVGDIDNDGDMDIAGLRNYNQPPIEIWRNLSADHKSERDISADIQTDITPLSLEKWHYMQVDNQRSRFGGRTAGDGYWFGLAMGDLNGDGVRDIAAGKWVYINPGTDMETKWVRHELGDSLDALMIMNVDDDELGDIIAVKCNRQYWIEPKDKECREFVLQLIGTLPVCNHGTSTQGYNLAQIIPGGKQEILLNDNALFCLIIPDNPLSGNWPYLTIVEEQSNGEWFSAGDMDADGDVDICLFMSREDTPETGMNDVVWCENLEDNNDYWKQHHVGITDFHGDKIIPADINGDGRTDLVVTEERWPGMVPDASMYWFEAPEDPAYWNWNRYTIVTQYSMNNLEVADLDLDGDADIITCEHKGPAEELQIWENDGSGNFSLHIVDRGKESHAGARLSDLDQDGDMDIISIAWNDFEYLHVWRNDAIKEKNTGNAECIPLGYQLTDDYRYYIPVTAKAGQNDFTDKVIEISVDLDKLKTELNEITDIDPGSFRVVEVNEDNSVIDETVAYQFNMDQGKTKTGQLAFMVKEGLQQGTSRYFRILFGPQGEYYVKPVFPKLVHFDDYIQYQDQQSYQVHNLQTDFFYHKQGGGFAGMVDNEGNDWISYRPGRGSGGEYRGIPNIRPAGFHPGDENLSTRLLESGPLKVAWLTETQDRDWACKWEVYPMYATMTMLKKGEKNYWLLYEGTPAGKLDAEKDYWVMSDGTKLPVSEDWTGVLPDPEWVWFGDRECHRVLFLAKHEYDDKPDQFWQMQGNMTVFGFGRKPHEDPGTYITDVPVHLTIGFVESKDYEQIMKMIRSAVNEPFVGIGKPQRIR